MLRTFIQSAALVLVAMTASCTGVSFRVLGVNVPSMTREQIREDPAHHTPSGFPPLCHRGPEEPTGPSPAPETCNE